MSFDDQERIVLLFNQALELDGAERQIFLDSNCNEETIRREVESLLHSHARAGSFLQGTNMRSGDGSADDPPIHPADPLLGAVVKDRYEIQSVLGSGGQGVAYLARDRAVRNRPVVVKMLSGPVASPGLMRSGFRRELEILAELNHPGVVGILDAGEYQDRLYLTIEYVMGATLRQLLMQKMDRATIASLLRQIGSAMAAVHAKGIAHRDLKPENILIAQSDGRVKLIDFGIARRPPSETVAGTTTFLVAGTLDYMAPEQFFCEHTLSSDIYALGVIVFEMLTGRLPFADNGASGRFQPKPVISLPPGLKVPRSTLELLRRALSSDPSLRPSDIGEMCERIARDLETPAPRFGLRTKIAVAGLAVLVAAAPGVWWMRDRFGWLGAKYERVVEAPAGYDPTDYGFRPLNEIGGKTLFNAAGSSFEGVREITSSQGFLIHPFTTAQQQAAIRKGWTVSGRIRAEEGGAYLIVDLDRIQRRYDIFVFRTSGGVVARLIDKLIPSLTGQQVTIPETQPVFHNYQMRFDPASRTALLAVDGQVVLSGYKGHSEYVNPYGLVIGVSKYLSDRGTATFAGERFEILP